MKSTLEAAEGREIAARPLVFHAGRPCGALDHPLRREICILLRARDLAASEVAASLRSHPPTLSHHLTILLRAGVVRVRPAGRRRIYGLESARALESWEAWLEPASRSAGVGA